MGEFTMEKQDLIRMTDNKNFTPEIANKLKKIYDELQELGLSGTFGSFAIAENDDEKELYLMLEKYFTGIEQRKIIEGPFVK